MQSRVLASDADQRYLLYVPKSANAYAPVLVTVHGISRNAREHVQAFVSLAERDGVVVVAPFFSERRYRDYQRLGRRGHGRRADKMLGRILTDVGQLTAANTGRVLLFGYSGGAQFAHRYTMLYPERIASTVIAAAGWYTFPDQTLDYPYGIGSVSELPGLAFEPDRFLRVPMSVLVGEHDVERDPGLRNSRRVDRQQGRTRVERGERWVKAMRLAARKRGFNTPYVFELLPDSDHLFDASVVFGQLADRVFVRLFHQGRHARGQPDREPPAPTQATVCRWGYVTQGMSQ